jgi:very-short-patch-repair endonuclease
LVNLYNKNLTPYARENRNIGNLSEALLWNQLKKKQTGYDFTKQKPIGNYIADFYCKELKLVIEIDGESHTGKKEYDKARDEYMNALGIIVIHINDIEVKKKMRGVLKKINTSIELAKTLPASRSLGTPPMEGNFSDD